MKNNIKLTDLISVEALQQLQDGFSKYTGMAALTTDSDGVPVTKGSGFTHFCMDLTRRSRLGCKNCEECDRNGALLTLKNGHATVYDCHAGLTDFAAPIMIDGKFIGSFIGGQVRTLPVDEEKMRAIAEKYSLDPDEYVAAAKQTVCLSKDEVIKAAEYLEAITAALSGLAYQNYLDLQKSLRTENAAKSQAEYVMSMSASLEKNMERWSEIIENTKNKTSDPEILILLSAMQVDETEMRSNITETIDYIRSSANKVEILETDYNLPVFVQQLKENIVKLNSRDSVNVEVVLGEHEDDLLFGDAGRIGQLTGKISRTILENKRKGDFIVEFSTCRDSYATILNIRISDLNSDYTDEEIAFIKEMSEKRDLQDSKDNEIFVSLESALIKQMECKYVFENIGRDFVISISIPQLGLRGGEQ